MAIEQDPRTGLKSYTSGTDPHPSRVDFNQQQLLLAAIMALAEQGASVDRPTAGKWGRFFWDTTVERLYIDDGTAWREITTNGGGGAGQPVKVGTGATEGNSNRSARADHVHVLELATEAVAGAMASGDKALLNTATHLATAGAMVQRDSAGRLQANTPSAVMDVATKGYVDGQINTRSATGHNHAAGDITSGILNPLRLPAVTVSAQGAMLAADKKMLDMATHYATANSLVYRDAVGRTKVSNPSEALDAANKSYVDSQISTRSADTHTHTFESITGKPLTYAPAPHSHAYSELTGIPSTFNPSGHTHSTNDITSGELDNARLRNIRGGDDWISVETPKGAMRLSSAGGFYTTQGSNTTFLINDNGNMQCDGVHSNVYSSQPNMVVSSAGYIGRTTWNAAPQNHNHSGGDITSGQIPNARIQGCWDAVYNNTPPSSTWTSVVITRNGNFYRYPSAEKYKTNIVDHMIEPERIYSLPPTIEFEFKEHEGKGLRNFGVSADRWENHLPELIIYDDEDHDHEVEGFRYEHMGIALVPAVQDLNGRLLKQDEQIQKQQALINEQAETIRQQGEALAAVTERLNRLDDGDE